MQKQELYKTDSWVVSFMQIQCYFCGEDSQGAEGAETSESHQQSKGVEGTTVALEQIARK